MSLGISKQLATEKCFVQIGSKKMKSLWCVYLVVPQQRHLLLSIQFG
jgi:hypothetical protein